MPFPTAQFVSVEEFSMVAVISRLTPSKCTFVSLLPNPSLTCLDFSSAVDAFVAAGNHFSPPARQWSAMGFTVFLKVRIVRRFFDLLFPDRGFFRANTANQRRCDFLRHSEKTLGIWVVSKRSDQIRNPSALTTLEVIRSWLLSSRTVPSKTI
jgi:hypothetical protein